MRVKLDTTIDAAYIYFTPIAVGEVANTFTCDPNEVGAEINLDFDENGILLGIEVHNASKKLPKEILETAEIIS